MTAIPPPFAALYRELRMPTDDEYAQISEEQLKHWLKDLDRRMKELSPEERRAFDEKRQADLLNGILESGRVADEARAAERAAIIREAVATCHGNRPWPALKQAFLQSIRLARRKL